MTLDAGGRGGGVGLTPEQEANLGNVFSNKTFSTATIGYSPAVSDGSFDAQGWDEEGFLPDAGGEAAIAAMPTITGLTDIAGFFPTTIDGGDVSRFVDKSAGDKPRVKKVYTSQELLDLQNNGGVFLCRFRPIDDIQDNIFEMALGINAVENIKFGTPGTFQRFFLVCEVTATEVILRGGEGSETEYFRSTDIEEFIDIEIRFSEDMNDQGNVFINGEFADVLEWNLTTFTFFSNALAIGAVTAQAEGALFQRLGFVIFTSTNQLFLTDEGVNFKVTLDAFERDYQVIMDLGDQPFNRIIEISLAHQGLLLIARAPTDDLTTIDGRAGVINSRDSIGSLNTIILKQTGDDVGDGTGVGRTWRVEGDSNLVG